MGMYPDRTTYEGVQSSFGGDSSSTSVTSDSILDALFPGVVTTALTGTEGIYFDEAKTISSVTIYSDNSTTNTATIDIYNETTETSLYSITIPALAVKNTISNLSVSIPSDSMISFRIVSNTDRNNLKIQIKYKGV